MVQQFCGYTGLLNFLFCLSFALFIYFKNPRNKINQTFSFWQLNVALWSLGYFVWLFTNTPAHALFWSRFLMAGAILIPAAFLHFTYTYLGIDNVKKNNLIIKSMYLFAIIYLFLDFTPLFIARVESRFWFRFWPVPGPLYHIYQIYFLGVVLYTHILFFRAAIRARGIQRKQLMFVAIGTAIAFGGGSTNFFIWYNIPIPPVLNFFVIGYVALVAYAVLNYRLWEIEVVIKKTIVFGGVSFAIFALFASTSFLITGVLQSAISDYARLWLFALLGMVSAAIIKPLDNLLVNITDKYLFQKKSDYAQILKDATKDITLVTSLEELTRKILYVLMHKARTKSAAIYVRSEGNDHLELVGYDGYGDDEPASMLSADHPLVSYLGERQIPITRVKVEEELHQTSSGFKHDKLAKTLETIKLLKAEVIIPSFLSSSRSSADKKDPFLKLQGFLLLGGQKSDEDYSQHVLDMLATIAQEHAITFENVRLFGVVSKEREARVKAESEARLAAFSKSIAHETKNSLAGLYGPAQFNTMYGYEDFKGIFDRYIQGKLPAPIEKKFLKTLERMKEEGQKVFTKSDEIRIIALTAQGTLSSSEDVFEQFDFKVVCDAAKAIAKPGDYKFVRDIPEKVFPYGNVQLVQRVLINLINNAAEAMEGQKNAEMTLKGGYEEIDGKKVAYFEFSDNGPGVSKENLSKIWDQGFSTKPKPKVTDIEASGHGQGLWVCKNTIEEIHKGKIWAESEACKGTTFKFWLPVSDGKIAQSGEDSPTSSSS